MGKRTGEIGLFKEEIEDGKGEDKANDTGFGGPEQEEIVDGLEKGGSRDQVMCD